MFFGLRTINCSFLLLLQKKRTKEKEAGNDNFRQNGRLLHRPCWRYRFVWSSHHFRVALAPWLRGCSSNLQVLSSFMIICSWISDAFKSFLEIDYHFGGCEAMGLRKHYCLTPSKARGSCNAWAASKIIIPKKIWGRPFLVHFLGEQKMNK